MKTETINVQGMHCIGCATSLKNALAKLPGVSSVTTNTASATLTYDEKKLNRTAIVQEIHAVGYDVPGVAAPRSAKRT